MLYRLMLVAVAVASIAFQSGCCQTGIMIRCKAAPQGAGSWYGSCDGCGKSEIDCGTSCGPGPACGTPIHGAPIHGAPLHGAGLHGAGLHKSGCRPHGIGCWRPGALLREIFACDGCTSPIYWNEWFSHRPKCGDPCDCYGNWIGPAEGGPRAYRIEPAQETRIYYERQDGPPPSASRLRSVTPASHAAGAAPKCSCGK